MDELLVHEITARNLLSREIVNDIGLIRLEPQLAGVGLVLLEGHHHAGITRRRETLRLREHRAELLTGLLRRRSAQTLIILDVPATRRTLPLFPGVVFLLGEEHALNTGTRRLENRRGHRNDEPELEKTRPHRVNEIDAKTLDV